jgi:hypothetical protein
VGLTVLHEGGEPSTGVAVVQVGDVRTIALTEDRALMDDMEATEWVGRDVLVPSPGVLTAT